MKKKTKVCIQAQSVVQAGWMISYTQFSNGQSETKKAAYE